MTFEIRIRLVFSWSCFGAFTGAVLGFTVPGKSLVSIIMVIVLYKATAYNKYLIRNKFVQYE